MQLLGSSASIYLNDFYTTWLRALGRPRTLSYLTSFTFSYLVSKLGYW